MIELVNRLKRKERRILLGLTVLVVLSLVFLLLIARTRRAGYFRSLRVQQTRQARLTELDTRRAEGKRELARWQEAVRDMAELRENRFYKRPTVLQQMRRDLSRLFKRTGMSDPWIKYDYSQFRSGGISKLTASFEISGLYPLIKKFLFTAENFPKFLVLEKIDFTGIDTQSGRLTLKVVLAGYYVE